VGDPFRAPALEVGMQLLRQFLFELFYDNNATLSLGRVIAALLVVVALVDSQAFVAVLLWLSVTDRTAEASSLAQGLGALLGALNLATLLSAVASYAAHQKWGPGGIDMTGHAEGVSRG
jgi:hypothetical protein